ncbi:hypothetical protein PAXRUDRAFT_715719 [Paxillus rubicundulus Ve08.2h10]|uniref:Uncharacterized protein n=1 Tax=Paxillus rubicundulus Ve08.2h10 TaxID=930991 RepID=A0A0D0DRQ6_9AGAM|nr:hypothetical protein PAXRUDRAFT_715719 [Paxillus rubicundulus Ve08.2h10]
MGRGDSEWRLAERLAGGCKSRFYLPQHLKSVYQLTLCVLFKQTCGIVLRSSVIFKTFGFGSDKSTLFCLQAMDVR